MTLALLQALIIASGGLTSLGALLILLILLDSKRGPKVGVAFALGYVAGYVGIGLASLWLGQALIPVDPDAESGPSPIRAGVFVVLGLIMITVAIRRRRAPPTAAVQPSILSKIDGQGPLRALGFGLLIPVLNVKNLAIYLSAISVLAAAPLSRVQGVLAVLLTAAVFCGALLGSLLVYAIFPRRAAAWLARLRQWIETNSRAIVGVLLPLVGSLLLLEGIRGLWLWSQ